MVAGAGPTASCFYEGTVRHRRAAPGREFRYRLALAYVDLDELPRLLAGRLLKRRPGLLRFRPADYLPGDAEQASPRTTTSLDAAIRSAVAQATGVRPTGPIRVLAQLRCYGRCFNPASFYYCFDAAGEQVEFVVVEVTNTPWGERQTYVADGRAARGGVVSDSFAKQMHVSPLMGMDQQYRFRAGLPGATLSLHIENRERDEPVFDATLSLRRRELTTGSARSFALRYPFETARVFALIYTQALRAKLAGAVYHPHPNAKGAA